MLEQLRRFSQLEAQARRVFLRAAVVLPVVSASLHFRGFRRTHAFLQERPLDLAAKTNPSSSSAAALTARMVRAAVRHGLGHPTCLEESLVLWWLLRRQGIDSELRIGVRKSGGKVEAHAWVEREGAALNEPQALHEHYAAFDATLTSVPPVPQ